MTKSTLKDLIKFESEEFEELTHEGCIDGDVDELIDYFVNDIEEIFERNAQRKKELK